MALTTSGVRVRRRPAGAAPEAARTRGERPVQDRHPTSHRAVLRTRTGAPGPDGGWGAEAGGVVERGTEAMSAEGAE
ncbi:hypothetical protein GCM10010400_72070 [Streptomyces aculeolatus]